MANNITYVISVRPAKSPCKTLPSMQVDSKNVQDTLDETNSQFWMREEVF
jgi:hypothetical protein